MTLPIKFDHYVTAINEALEFSLTVNYPVYLFRINEGGYVLDQVADVYANEKLILKLFKGLSK